MEKQSTEPSTRYLYTLICQHSYDAEESFKRQEDQIAQLQKILDRCDSVLRRHLEMLTDNSRLYLNLKEEVKELQRQNLELEEKMEELTHLVKQMQAYSPLY